MSKRKLGLAILSTLLCVCIAMIFVACGTQGEKGEAGKDGISIESVEKIGSEGLTDTYKITYSDGNSTTFTVTNGKDGADGSDGENGQTPFIGENGNWWIGSVDTGVPAKGQDGSDGENGSDGEDGTDGEDGQTPFIGENGNWWIGSVDTGVPAKGQDGADGENGADGKDGISITNVDINDAGELILYFSEGEPLNLGKIIGENGQDGEDGTDGKDGVGIEGATIDENGNLILSLSNDTDINVGKVKGEDGQDGTDGKDGISITGVKIENGELIIAFSDGNSSNLGNIIGADGKDGTDGKDGVGIERIELDEEYNLTIYLTEGEPISLGCIRGEKGENGANGKSAYELYKDKFGYQGTEEQWLIDLANGNLAVVETHTVTFDAQGGSPVPEAQEVKHLGKASKPENPVKDGFLFDGWYYQGEKWSFVGYVVTEDMILTAQWSEADSGCEITSAEGFEFGTEIIDENEVQTITRKVANATQNFNLAAAIRVSEGCTWRLFADYAQSEEIASKIMTDLQTGDNIAWLVVYGASEQTLYKVNVYRRHIRNYIFQSEGETHTSGTIEEDHKLNIPETNPTNKTGYTFSHWTVDGEQVIFPYTVTVDTTFIAVFTPNNNTLHFDGNGATGGSMDDMKIATDASANLTANGYVRAGYTFKGWATSAGGAVEYTDGAQYTMGTESKYTLYAVWEANNNTLHFDGNGATSGSMEDMTIATDASANLMANGYVRAGYTFKGWATSAGGGVEYADGASYIMGTESEYTLYAVWEANNNTLHFDKNDENATGQMNSVQMKTDEVQNLPAVGFEKAGYHLKGWATNAEGEPEYADQATYTMGTESEYTLYAVWEANNNTLHFDGNGATGGSMEDMLIATDASANLTANAFERTGYTFEGWATSADGEVEYADGAQYTMGTESEYTLYAVWKIITYTITYELDGGQNNEVNPTTFTVEDLPITLHELTKEESLFRGWYTTEDFSGEQITELSDVGNITLHAKFIGSQYLQYSKRNGGYAVTGYTGTQSEIFIPDHHLNEPVIEIGEEAFYNYTELETVIFGENSLITSIGKLAFARCSSLISIKLPSGVTSIVREAFRESSSLTSIELPSGITSIEDFTFYKCSSLTSVIFGDNSQLMSIGDYAFRECSSLTSIEIPSGVTSIGGYTFQGCSSLTSIEIPSGVTSIGGSAFSGCGLTSIELPSGITSIGDSTFWECRNLESIEIPSGVTSIGDGAFFECGLEMVFYGGASKEDWAAISIGGFNTYLTSATRYYYSENEPPLNEDGTAYDGNYWHYVNGIPSKWELVELKTFHFETNGGNSIGDIVATALTSLPTPIREGYWFVGWYDNPECLGTAITVPYSNANNTTLYAKWMKATGDQSEGLEIRDGVIVGIGTCTDTVLHIYLPIAENAFNSCSQITEVYLYDGCNFIGEKAFDRCSNLKSVYFMQTTMPEISSDVFANTWNSESFLVFVPQELYDEYAAVEDSYWQKYIVDAGKLYPME